MFREIYEYCLTPASFQARKTGYLYEAVAFESRARRNERYWKPHWQVCHNLFESFAQRNDGSRSLVIFGSGCLFEIPKNKLQKNFDQVTLVDQVFPRSVRAWVKNQKMDIRLIECDLSKSFPKNLRSDLVVSANLLSQLSLPCPDQKKPIEEKHLEDLESLKSPTLLWTDIVKVFSHRDSKEILHRQETVLTDLGKPNESWIWNLAPAPEWDKKIDIRLEMAAIEF